MPVRLYILTLPLIILTIIGCSGGSSEIPDPIQNPPEPEDNGFPVVSGGFIAQPGLPAGIDDIAEGSIIWTPHHGDDPVQPLWEPDTSQRFDIEKTDLFIESTNGNKIHVTVHRPVIASHATPCHGLILIPGGIMPGSAWHNEWYPGNSLAWARTGFVVADFDCQGRGTSEGVEDYYGPVHREDLRAVILYIASRDDVLPGGIGLMSSSFGNTLCAGTLAAYPDLPVRFWVDKEGQQDRFDATKWGDEWFVDVYGGHDTDDVEFWSEREAIRFMPNITVPYIRLQTDCDHVFDFFYVDHAINLTNAATSGMCPYTRMNDNPTNMIFELENKLEYRYVLEEDYFEAVYMFPVLASTMTY